MININRSETHDRLLQFKQQEDYISKGCQECIDQRPEEFTMPFYIFAHQRTIETDERYSIFNQDIFYEINFPGYIRKYKSFAEVPTARLIWAPRLTKPTPQSNSMLFKYYPEEDQIKILWIIPARELWDQFMKGKLTESEIVVNSIHDFQFDREKMAAPEADDISEERVKAIYEDIKKNPKYGKKEFEMI